ncbi:hypothetical protein A3709_10515 [Halioglobus sp. HI00S01]|nr:hypothetical protein A3709_10515 [Halioglobus sp. HI00S01]
MKMFGQKSMSSKNCALGISHQRSRPTFFVIPIQKQLCWESKAGGNSRQLMVSSPTMFIVTEYMDWPINLV